MSRHSQLISATLVYPSQQLQPDRWLMADTTCFGHSWPKPLHKKKFLKYLNVNQYTAIIAFFKTTILLLAKGRLCKIPLTQYS